MLYEVITEELTLFEGKTNDEGIAQVEGNLEVSDMAPGIVITSYSIHYTKLYDIICIFVKNRNILWAF